jgi:hypothetical protein
VRSLAPPLARDHVKFQHVEDQLTELLELMAVTRLESPMIALNGRTHADEEFVRILVNKLNFDERIKSTDVMFARFVDLLSGPNDSAKNHCHDLMTKLRTLGERRNLIVHSKYTSFISVEGAVGLRRTHSKLVARAGERKVEEEDLFPESFAEDLERLDAARQSLETFRLQTLKWSHGEEA